MPAKYERNQQRTVTGDRAAEPRETPGPSRLRHFLQTGEQGVGPAGGERWCCAQGSPSGRRAIRYRADHPPPAPHTAAPAISRGLPRKRVRRRLGAPGWRRPRRLCSPGRPRNCRRRTERARASPGTAPHLRRREPGRCARPRGSPPALPRCGRLLASSLASRKRFGESGYETPTMLPCRVSWAKRPQPMPAGPFTLRHARHPAGSGCVTFLKTRRGAALAGRGRREGCARSKLPRCRAGTR